MESYLETLLGSWKKYKDKKGAKAQGLKLKIKSVVAFDKLSSERRGYEKS